MFVLLLCHGFPPVASTFIALGGGGGGDGGGGVVILMNLFCLKEDKEKRDITHPLFIINV